MKKVFRLGNYRPSIITEVEIEKETEKFIKIKGRHGRTMKINNYEKFYSTKQDAIDAAKSIVESKIRNLEMALEKEKKELKKINSIQP